MSGLPDSEALAMFARVAEAGSYAAAARELGVSVATVSRAVSRLEDRFGGRLFNRNSRRLALSEFGRSLAERAGRVWAEARDIEQDVVETAQHPRGVIKLAAPMAFGVRWVAPQLPDFLQRYPVNSAFDAVGAAPGGRLSAGAAGRDRRGERARLRRAEQRRVPRRLRHGAGRLRGGGPTGVRDAGLAGGPPRRPRPACGGPPDGGGRPAVHHPGPLRRRPPRPLQVQLRRVSDYPALRTYLGRLLAEPAFSHIKPHYYRSHPWLNPSGVVPLGPLPEL